MFKAYIGIFKAYIGIFRAYLSILGLFLCVFVHLFSICVHLFSIEQASLVTGAPYFCGITRFSLSLSTRLLGSAWAPLEGSWVPLEGSWTPLGRLLGRSWRPLEGILKQKNGIRSWKRKKKRKKCQRAKTVNLLPPPGSRPWSRHFRS